MLICEIFKGGEKDITTVVVLNGQCSQVIRNDLVIDAAALATETPQKQN